MDKLRMKFSALNVDFKMVQSIFYVQGNLRTVASKIGTSVEVFILPLLASLSWKRLQIGRGMLPVTTSTSDKLFSHVNFDDFEKL